MEWGRQGVAMGGRNGGFVKTTDILPPKMGNIHFSVYKWNLAVHNKIRKISSAITLKVFILLLTSIVEVH